MEQNQTSLPNSSSNSPTNSQLGPEPINSPTAPQQSMISRFKHASAFELFLAEDSEAITSTSMEEDSSSASVLEPSPPNFKLEECINIVGKSSLTTDTILISFLPEWMKRETFCALMDIIFAKLVSASTLTAKPPGHLRPGFADYCTETPPQWMVLYHPQERRGSYLCQLPVSLTFSPVGSFHGIQPPRFFPILHNRRTYLVQAVPSDFRPTFLRSPELAFWRCLGADFSSGLPSSIIPIIEDHTELALRTLFLARDLDQRYRHFSYLAPHYVNIQEDAPTAKPSKGKNKASEQRRGPPVQHSWQECFVVTVSTVPVGREHIAFQALLPAVAPFGTKLHPIDLFGWRGEVASQLSLFRSWAFSPDPSLLIPQPVMCFSAIRTGFSLLSLCEALKQDFQTWEGIFYCFVHRGDTDTLFLATDGRSLSTTPSLRNMSYGGGAQLDPDLPGMTSQRACYRRFKPMAPPPSLFPAPMRGARPTPSTSRGSGTTTPTGPSYATVVQRPSVSDTMVRTYVQQETRHILQELTSNLAHEATTMVANAVSPLQTELQAAREEICALKAELEKTTSTSAQALAVGQNAVQLVLLQTTELEAQRARDLHFKTLLYETLTKAGLPLPDEAELLLPVPSAKRRATSSTGPAPMDSSNG